MSFQIDKKDRKYQFVILCYFIYFFSCMLRNSTPCFVCPSVRQLFGQSVGWSVGWLVGWSVGQLVGRLVGWSVRQWKRPKVKHWLSPILLQTRLGKKISPANFQASGIGGTFVRVTMKFPQKSMADTKFAYQKY